MQKYAIIVQHHLKAAATCNGLYCLALPAVPCVFRTAHFALRPFPSSPPLQMAGARDSNRPSSKARFGRVAAGLWDTGRKDSETSLLGCSAMPCPNHIHPGPQDHVKFSIYLYRDRRNHLSGSRSGSKICQRLYY